MITINGKNRAFHNKTVDLYFSTSPSASMFISEKRKKCQ